VIALLAALGVTTCSIRARPRHPRAQGGSTMAEAMGISTFRYKVTMFVLAAVLAACRAGCSRTSSAASTPRPSASTRASSTCSWPCWAAWAMCGAPSLGLGRGQAGRGQLQVLLPQLIGTSGNFEIIVFGSCWWWC
jgi:branched-chain amino acid transport system permease protein